MLPIKKITLNLFWIIFRSALLVIIAFGVYYTFWLLPDQQLVSSLAELEQHTASHYFTLLSHRLAIFELALLDESSPDYDREKAGIISQLATFTLENNDLLTDELQFQPSRLTALSEAGKLEHELLTELNNARQEHRSVITEQQSLLQSIKDFDQASGRLSSFLPDYYFNQFSLPEEKEALANQLSNARQGVLDIKVTVERLPARTSDMSRFIQTAVTTTTQLETLSTTLRATDSEAIDELNNARLQAVKSMNTLRDQMQEAQISILKETAALTLLTKETNTLLTYRHLLDHLNAEQSRLFTHYAAASQN